MQCLLRAIVLAGTLAGSASTARAQSDEQRANARALATQGARAFSEGRWQDAVDLFDRAESLVHAPPHLLFGARAHAKLHHYVKARELYLRIVNQQLAADAPNAFHDAQTKAAQELKDVEPHIGQLTISLRGADPQVAKVMMDGAVVQSVLIGVSRPIDPGEHQIRAEAPGFRSQTTKVTVGDGATSSVAFELVRDPTVAAHDSGAHGAPAGNAPASPPSTGESPADQGRASTSSGKRLGAYIAFGVGAVGLGAGTVFVLSSASKRSQADEKFDECGGPTGCTNDNPLSREVTTLDESAGTAKTLGIVGYAVGGVAIGTGVVLLLMSGGSKKSSAATGVTLVPRIGLGSAGVAGSF